MCNSNCAVQGSTAYPECNYFLPLSLLPPDLYCHISPRDYNLLTGLPAQSSLNTATSLKKSEHINPLLNILQWFPISLKIKAKVLPKSSDLHDLISF